MDRTLMEPANMITITIFPLKLHHEAAAAAPLEVCRTPRQTKIPHCATDEAAAALSIRILIFPRRFSLGGLVAVLGPILRWVATLHRLRQRVVGGDLANLGTQCATEHYTSASHPSAIYGPCVEIQCARCKIFTRPGCPVSLHH